MPIFSVEDLRKQAGPAWGNASDEDLISAYATKIKADPVQVAQTLGFDLGSGGLTAKQVSSSVDRYQAGLYGLGEEVTKAIGAEGVSSWMGERRRANELQGDVAALRARNMGAVDEWKDVHGAGDFGSYIKSLGIQSGPYALEALGGGALTRGAMTGTRAALTAAEESLSAAKTAKDAAAVARAEQDIEKAKKTLNIGSTVGGTAASYPSSVGDILSNQREQTGTTNLAAAGALGIPYAAFNALGETGMLARGQLARNPLNILDSVGGVKGAIARTGATATKVGLEEGIGETGQEVINQLGRMSVDPNATLTDPAAIARYKESFIGGAALGGVMGGALGGWRRKGSILPEANQDVQTTSTGNGPSSDIAQTFAQNDRTTPDSIMAGLTGGSAVTGSSRDPLAGRSKLVPPVIGPTSVPRPEVPALNPEAARANPPAVAGGSTDVAQQTQAQFMQQQQAQQEQANQAARDKTFQTLGAQYSPETGGQLNIFGAQLFGDAKINAFGNTLAAKLNALPPVAHQIADAVAQAHELTGNLVSLKLDGGNPIGSADKVMKALAKTTDKFQIGHVQSVEQAADILESLSKTAKGNDLDQGNAIHYALTGRETSGYIASQQSKAEKGAKNVQQPKLQTTTGVGKVPVQSGAGEAGNGGAGPVRPTQVQPIGAGGLGEGSLGLQTGQLPAEGIRAGASGNAVTNDVDQSKAREEINDLLQKVFGGTRPEGEFNEAENTTEAGAGVGPTGQSGQAKEPTVVTATSEGNGGPRKYEIPAQYYNTDIMHIRPERRQQIINEVLGGALTPEVDRENTISQEDRVDIVRMSLLEDMTAPDIALELGLKKDAVDQQRLRLGIRLGTYGLEINQSIDSGRKFMASLMLSAENFRSPEFPDGIGAKEFAGLYSAKDLYYDKGKFQHMGKPVEEEQEEGEQPAVTTDVKLQEELKNKPESETATQSAGQIKTAGGSQGNVDALKKSRKNKETGEQVLDIGALDQITNLEAEADRIRDALEDMAPKDPRRSALLDRLDAIGDVDSGELGALWGQYAKAQTMRSAAANAQGVKIDKDAEEAAEVTTPTELTGEEITASEREDERRKEAAEKAKADQGEENAVQVKSTDEGNVRKPAGGGEEVGEANAKPKKPAGARKAKTEVQLVEKAKQEVKTPEEQWSALADQFPGMPPYESLSKDEKIRWDDVASRGVANLAAANTVLTTTVKAGTTETPNITGDAKTLAPEVEKLTEGQTTRLEQHYGAKRGTDDFFSKLGEDVVAYASKGAEAVSAAIRDIVRILAQGVLAAAIVVNPTLAKMNFQFNLPRVISQTTEVRAAVPDVAKAKMSEAAQVTYSAVAPIAKQANKAFMITDKADGMLHVFHADGNPILQAPSLLGGDVGDTLQGGKKITPAGKFTLKFTADPEYYGGFRYDLVETRQVDGIIAIHAVYTGEASEKRPERLATPTPKDNRISWGCINVTNENMVDTLIPAKNELNGSLMFVMPENSEDIAQLFPAMTQTTETTEGTATSKTETRSVVAKEEENNVRFSKISKAALIEKKPVARPNATLDVRVAINKLFGISTNAFRKWEDRIQVHSTPDEAFRALGGRVPLLQLANAQGFVDPRDERVVHLIASNIERGTEASVLIHELGVHVGLKHVLGANFKILEKQVGVWEHSNKNTAEYQIWEAANARVVAGRLEGAVSAEDVAEELVAYAAEEAVRRGYKPTKNSTNKLEKFLQSIKDLFEAAFKNFFKVNTVPNISAQDLVDFASAAAHTALNGVRIESGAQENAPISKVMHYYAGTDLRGKLSNSAEMEEFVDEKDKDAPGQEQFNWGKDSSYGPFNNITTDAYYNTKAEGTQVFQVVVTSQESRKIAAINGDTTSFGDALQTVMLTSNSNGYSWDLIIQGPEFNSPLYWTLNLENLANETLDTFGKNNWTRLESVPMRDTLRLLVEARRRLTRLLGGRIPNIDFVRVTGSGKNIKGEGRFGKITSEELSIKFSKMPRALQTPTKTVVGTLLNSGKGALVNRNEDLKHILLAAGITEDVANGASKYMPSAQDYLANQYERQGTRIEHEQRIQKIEEAFEKLPTELQGTGANSVNAFIYDSTTSRKWGYKPSYNPNVKVDPDMKARFEAMPSAAQNVVRMVFDHGYQSLRMKQQAVKAAADKEFAQREQDANGDQEQLNNIAAERRGWEAKYDRLMNIKNDMPYAYLGRYGDYVAVAKSETYVDAEELSAKGDLDATKWLEENQSDGNHYIVEFAETMAEAKAKADEWKASGKFKHVYGAEKEVSEAFVGGSDLFMGITRLRNMLTRRVKSNEITVNDQEVLTALNKTVSDLYLATVSEASAHRTAMQRKNITGADKDMMRNLATRGRADAHFLASLKHNEDITDSISAMRDEAKADPTNARPYLNELLKRYARDINYKTPAPWSRTLTRLGHTWFLSFNPAFYLQQMTQTYVLSLPYLAGRLGYFRSMRAINNAYKDVFGLVKDTNVNEHLDFSKAPADVRDMLQKLVRMGKIDIGIDADAVVYANERTVTSSVMRKLNGINNRIEAINRSTAAIAAYRGYIQRYGVANAEAAVKFAADTVSNTHGSYDGFNTPRILNSNVGKVIGQFKRFQIIQLSMLGKLFKQAFGNASAPEKLIARRTLGFIGGHMAVLGGALGVPFVSQIAYMVSKIIGLFSDEDEPEDYEYQLRQAIDDPTVANLLLRGVPAAFGLESVGKKLAMENVAAILPFTDIDMTSRSGAEKMLVGLMGPTAALSLKAADALGMIGKGEYYKGLELALPNGFGNAMKGYRFATEGITMRNGDLVLSPEEISYVDAAFQAVGLPTNTITHRQYTQKVEAEFDKYYSDRASEIKGSYVNASRERDSEGMSAARQEWEELQDSRRKNGYKIQPMSELFKSLVAARKREASVVNGVETTKANKQFVANII
jgi:hypothetical protein